MSAKPLVEAIPDSASPGSADIRVGNVKFWLDRQLFQGELDLAAKKRLFSRSVDRVVLELSAYCNRRCTFCPNTAGTRIGRDSLRSGMSFELLDSIVGSLAEIEYDRLMLLHLYNEPLADPALAQKIALIRSRLPKPKLHLNTNGDYLTAELLKDLVEAGLSSLAVSLYGPNHGEYVESYLRASFRRIFEIVGAKGQIIRRGQGELASYISFDHQGHKFPITVFAKDFNTNGYDRGKSVQTGSFTARLTPCASVFNELVVSWDGTVVPCCNVHPHHGPHKQYTIGKVSAENRIFDVFHSETMRQWRAGLATFSPCLSPCDTCTRSDYPSAAEDEMETFNRVVERLMGATEPVA
jgi:hypothetical protein